MCDCCQKLQSMIDKWPRTVGRLIIWHEEHGHQDHIQVSLQRDDRTEVGTGDTIAEAVDSLEKKLATYG
jgi:hypothetical protein